MVASCGFLYIYNKICIYLLLQSAPPFGHSNTNNSLCVPLNNNLITFHPNQFSLRVNTRAHADTNIRIYNTYVCSSVITHFHDYEQLNVRAN